MYVTCYSFNYTDRKHIWWWFSRHISCLLVFTTSTVFILPTGKVLVHCIMGVSRSSTLVLSYLMLHQRLTLRAAIQQVIQRRPIYPNRNFLGLLLELDTQLLRKRMICPILWQHNTVTNFTMCVVTKTILLKLFFSKINK